MASAFQGFESDAFQSTQVVRADLGVSWRLKAAVEADKAIAWRIRTSVEADRAIAWRLQGAAQPIAVGGWPSLQIGRRQRSRVRADLVISWGIVDFWTANRHVLLAEIDEDLAELELLVGAAQR
jgi:hypothetical protein